MSDKFILKESQDQSQLNFISREHMLFPTPFWQTQVQGVDNEPIKEYCYKMREETEGVVISNRGGWHSKEVLQPIPNELQNFFNQVTSYVNNYCAQITGITDLALGNFWVNINPPGTYNRRHDHQKAILSGVYYVDCEGDNIGKFVVERDDHMEFFAGKYMNSPIMQQSYDIVPFTGFLFVLPAWTYHSVEMNMEDRDRISIAFNFVDSRQPIQQTY